MSEDRLRPHGAEPSGLPEADSLALVGAAADRLWTPEGADALRYLRERRLTDATIKAARLGWTPEVMVPTRDGNSRYGVTGIVIPWFDDAGELALVKVRQPDGRQPKYVEVFRDPARVVCYPSLGTIQPGRPLMIVEGEFDALLLGQALGETAAVVTLVSASNGLPEAVRNETHFVSRLYLAHDADPAGDKAADPAKWPARARRVRPPSPTRTGRKPPPPGWTWPGPSGC